jgi:hypothetical protein
MMLLSRKMKSQKLWKKSSRRYILFVTNSISLIRLYITVDLCKLEWFQQAISAYGYEIVQTLIVDIVPDEHVKRAMNEINAGKFF